MSDVTPAEKAAEALEAARQEIYGWSVSEGFMPTETVMRQIDEALDALRSPADAQTPVGVEAELIEKLRVAANGLGSLKSERGDYGLLDEAADALARVMGERDELQFAFDAGWAADKRAIERWQQETGRDLVWPDRADLGVWLLNRLEAAEKEAAALRVAMLEAQRIARNGCLVPPDGGEPTEGEREMCDRIADLIAALTQEDRG